MSHFARNGRSAKSSSGAKWDFSGARELVRCPFWRQGWMTAVFELQWRLNPTVFGSTPKRLPSWFQRPWRHSPVTLNVCIQLQTQMIKSARSVPEMICYCLKNISIEVGFEFTPQLFFFDNSNSGWQLDSNPRSTNHATAAPASSSHASVR